MANTPRTPAKLALKAVSKSFGQGQARVAVMCDISAEAHAGEIVCIVGPSGVGKSTLLRILAGLMAPTSGSVVLDGEAVREPPRGLAVVFQDYSRSLMPWLRVIDNVTLPLRSQPVAPAQREQRAKQALADVGLSEVDRLYPWQLSGGMQQRVAIARALAYGPDVLLMDEPFASVDAQTRADLEDLLLRIREERGLTVVLVTHDIDESVYLADRVIVLTGRPASVTASIDVPLPLPRDQITTKADPRFVSLRTRILRLIKGDAAVEVMDGRIS